GRIASTQYTNEYGVAWVGVRYVVIYAQSVSSILSCQSFFDLEITFFNKLQNVLLNASAILLAAA
ncbi:hypothetical protein NL463_29325, partial [Klebsiella pneumoniae]|nr:hypothetical protein [Klebsiella pneumoniae]